MNSMRWPSLKVGVDVDDVLYECIQYAIDCANRDHKYNPPIVIGEVKDWGPSGKRTDIVMEYFEKPQFFMKQPVREGAKAFMEALSNIAEVFILTAVKPAFMGIRALRLLKDFNISEDHLIMGYRKDMINVDVLLDDKPQNILSTPAAYPVLYSRPWNDDVTGCFKVKNYIEFINLIKRI